jgi:hypothetical protein
MGDGSLSQGAMASLNASDSCGCALAGKAFMATCASRGEMMTPRQAAAL